MKPTKVSCNSQLYSEHQTVYTPRAKFPQADAVYNHRDKPRMAQTCFPTEAYIQVAIASPDELSELRSLLSPTPGRGA